MLEEDRSLQNFSNLLKISNIKIYGGTQMGLGRKRSILKMKRKKSQAKKKARIKAKINAKK